MAAASRDVPAQYFLLSPAHCGGLRAQMLMRPGAGFDLACRVRSATASLAEVFTFLSGLYFRGKIEYARRFARPRGKTPGALVITAGRGLVAADQPIGLEDLEAFAAVPIDVREGAYRKPLERTVRKFVAAVPSDARVVLLGSIATPKYVEILTDALGPRLLFPSAFVGRGDMSRGGLLLRSARSGEELDYVPVLGALRHGPRPPRLPPA